MDTLNERLIEALETGRLNLSYLGGAAAVHDAFAAAGGTPVQLRVVELDLSSNALEVLPPLAATFPSLRALRAKYNKLSRLPVEQLYGLTGLEALDSEGNQIVELEGDALPALPALRRLNLAANGLSALPDCIARCRALEALTVSNNPLTQLPEALAACPITHLDVSSCQLASLPQALATCRTLQRIFCQNNELPRVPTSLGHLPNLKEWNLRANRLPLKWEQARERGLAKFLAFLREEEEIEVLQEVERNRPVGIPSGPCTIYRCKATMDDVAAAERAFEPIDGFAWIRSGHAVVQHRSQLLLWGGVVVKEGRKSADLLVLNTDTMGWRLQATRGDRPCPRDGHSLVVDPSGGASGQLILFGGCNPSGRRLNDLHVLDLATWTWFVPKQEGAALPAPREQAAAAFSGDGRMLLFGGRTDGSRLNDLWSWEVESGAWEQLPVHGTAPSPRQGAAACVAGGQLFVMGGASNFVLHDCCVYSLEAQEWRALNIEGSGKAAARAGGHIIMYQEEEGQEGQAGQQEEGSSRTANGQGVLWMFGGKDALGAQVSYLLKLKPMGGGAWYEWVETEFSMLPNRSRVMLFDTSARLNIVQCGHPLHKLDVPPDQIEKGQCIWDVVQVVPLSGIKERAARPEDQEGAHPKRERINHATLIAGKLPPPFSTNTPREQQLLAVVAAFRQRCEAAPGGTHSRLPLCVVLPNECGVDKCVCTTLRRTALPHVELHDIGAIAQFVSEFCAFEPLEDLTQPPTHLVSPWSLLEWQAGDSFDLATLACSLLLGAGYNAFVAVGYTTKQVAMCDQSQSECPFLSLYGLEPPVYSELPEEEPSFEESEGEEATGAAMEEAVEGVAQPTRELHGTAAATAGNHAGEGAADAQSASQHDAAAGDVRAAAVAAVAALPSGFATTAGNATTAGAASASRPATEDGIAAGTSRPATAKSGAVSSSRPASGKLGAGSASRPASGNAAAGTSSRQSTVVKAKVTAASRLATSSKPAIAKAGSRPSTAAKTGSTGSRPVAGKAPAKSGTAKGTKKKGSKAAPEAVDQAAPTTVDDAAPHAGMAGCEAGQTDAQQQQQVVATVPPAESTAPTAQPQQRRRRKRYVHAFVLVKPGRRELTQAVLLDPATGRMHGMDDAPCTGVEFCWNDRNFWVSLQTERGCGGDGTGGSGLAELGVTDWSFSNPNCWLPLLLNKEDLLADTATIATQLSLHSSKASDALLGSHANSRATPTLPGCSRAASSPRLSTHADSAACAATGSSGDLGGAPGRGSGAAALSRLSSLAPGGIALQHLAMAGRSGTPRLSLFAPTRELQDSSLAFLSPEATLQQHSSLLPAHSTASLLPVTSTMGALLGPAPGTATAHAAARHSSRQGAMAAVAAGPALPAPPPDMPLSWVPALCISRERLDMRCPRGHKVVAYRQVRHELHAGYGECARWDGLVERLTLHCGSTGASLCVLELFSRRKDRLARRLAHPGRRTMLSEYEPGAAACLRSVRLVRGAGAQRQLELAFHADRRADGLLRRQRTATAMEEWFLPGSRPDGLLHRTAQYMTSLEAQGQLTSLAQSGRRSSLAMAGRPVSRPSGGGAGAGGQTGAAPHRRRSSVVVGLEVHEQAVASIVEEYSTSIAAATTTTGMAGTAGTAGVPHTPGPMVVERRFDLMSGEVAEVQLEAATGAAEVQEATRTTFAYDADGQFMVDFEGARGKHATIAQEQHRCRFAALVAASRSAHAAVVAAEEETRDIVQSTQRQEQGDMLVTAHFDATRVKVEESDGGEVVVEEDPDTYDPVKHFLPHTGARDMTAGEARQAAAACLAAFDDRQADRQRLLNMRMAECGAELARLRAVDPAHLAPADQERLLADEAAAVFRMTVVQRRAEEHGPVAAARRGELEAKLAVDRRLAAALAAAQG